jgi:hypothetical protein
MKLVWTSGNSILSRGIQWLLGEPVSHFAIVYYDHVVFQSNLLGTGLEWFGQMLKTHKVVYSIDVPLPQGSEHAVMQQMLDQYSGEAYDYPAFAYFTWRGFLRKCFGIPLPSQNKWDRAGTALCVELAKAVPIELLPTVGNTRDLGMTSPYALYCILSGKNPGTAQ